MTPNLRKRRYGGASDFQIARRLATCRGSRQGKAWAASIVWFDLGGGISRSLSARESNPLWVLARLFDHLNLDADAERELPRLLVAAGMPAKVAAERCRCKMTNARFYKLGSKVYAGTGERRKDSPHAHRQRRARTGTDMKI